MEMVSVDSSNVAAVGYDDETETLAVEFNSGSVYHYSNVSRDTFEALRDAPSVGKYFNANIRDIYEYEKVS